jgi:hypothetical protein
VAKLKNCVRLALKSLRSEVWASALLPATKSRVYCTVQYVLLLVADCQPAITSP